MTFFRQLHGRCDGTACLQGIQPVLVAQIVRLDDRGQITDSAIGAQPVDGLVFGTLAVAVELSMSRDLGHAPAVDHATVAAPVARHELFFHDWPVHRFGLGEYALLKIVRGQHPDHVHIRDGPRGAQHGQPAGRRPGHELVAALEHGILERAGIGDGEALGAQHGHGLELLRSHDRAHARAACGPALVVHHAGGPRQILPAGADAGDARLRVRGFPDHVFGVVDDLAPQVFRVADLDRVVVDVEIHGLFGRALEHQVVVARVAQRRSPIAARVGRGDRAGERRLGHHHVAPRGGRVRAGGRAGGEDERIGRRERVGARVHSVHQQFRGDPASPHVVPQNLFRDGLFLHLFRAEIHP